ncbi:MAG: phosphomannose isomerase type II C-terminal cupin domain [Nanoarchaeota archaeon]|nr:phosphomannose isomerase type II C-terminal cupin domain [Nanoarchaeota archaeon]MBU1632488.1 phosphomannose isomerase type II C-terminal cupin domain [Nanoarchaeota archaeon]MBU1876648.1 phosphomannose isomerase type II C-terminal cupin domain [Nanoarchaeota archaeon]
MKPYSEKRPWGEFERFTLNKLSTVKILTIKPKQKFSLQYHYKRNEFWKFLDNPAKVTLEKKTILVKKGAEIFIPAKTLHRIEAYSKSVRVLEISFGKFDEKDIKRIEDVYGRK